MRLHAAFFRFLQLAFRNLWVAAIIQGVGSDYGGFASGDRERKHRLCVRCACVDAVNMSSSVPANRERLCPSWASEEHAGPSEQGVIRFFAVDVARKSARC